MYTPNYTAETRVVKLHALIDSHSFGTLLCNRPDGTLDIAHLPFILDQKSGPQGTLLSHVALANPIWRSLESARQVNVIFQGPNGYISPRWYTSRAEVPTWNYAVVHAYGNARLLESNDLTVLLDRMAVKYEMGAKEPWRPDELPADLFAELKAEIVGFAVDIMHLKGKFKLSQNRSPEDRRGAIAGILRRNDSLDTELAELMEEALKGGE